MTIDLPGVPTGPGLPTTLAANLWSGRPTASGELNVDLDWILTDMAQVAQLMRPGAGPDDTDPTDPRVGWGLVLPARDDLCVAARAAAMDAEEPLRELLAHRGAAAKVLRYRDDYGPLALFEADNEPVPIGAEQGVAHGSMPRYLLLAGGPDVLPWSLQYTFAPTWAVGRLHLSGAPLARYVDALLRDSPPGAARYGAPLVWAVDHGVNDMTSLMRDKIAAQVFENLAADNEMPNARFLDGQLRPGDTTATSLAAALADTDPALVITTSHGMTGPLGDALAMRRDLGLLVDSLHSPVQPATLLDAWQPDGAIWYSHACCSAGSDSPSAYMGLLDRDDDVDKVLTEVAGLGATIAPLPTALLGADKPLRAFIGHVEPTFEWTIKFPWTHTDLTAGIRTALYDRICRGEPVGYAMQQVWRDIGPLRQGHAGAVTLYNNEPRQAQRGLTAALYCRLAAADRAGTVVLGDPAARLHPPIRP